MLEDQGYEDVALGTALSERYLAYALSTITARSLPDIRDGLKPVHRRLLYAMHGLRLNPQARFKKSARIVGDVMGKFHPHGDQAIYDALARLAQDFSVRYPLIEGMGNFGNIDGDNDAAMRYTEARLSAVAELLLQGIDAAAVNLRETYDGEGVEPDVLPANFPNLLANGANGIAVGMATAIPPHNLEEICSGLQFLLENPQCCVVDLMQFVKAPDFPTGGVIYETRETLQSCYETGRGSIRLRARWQAEELSRGSWQIIVTEIPYQINKMKLIERLADLVTNKKSGVLADISDESTSDVRIVLVPTAPRNTSPKEVMEVLFALSDLETRVSVNMNVLDDLGRVPKVMNLKQMMQGYLDHRFVVLRNISANRLREVKDRLVILAGLLVCYANLDEIIAIIREKDDAKAVIMNRFYLLDVQADAILNMRLRALRKLAEQEIRKEAGSLEKEKAKLEKLLASKITQKRAIQKEIGNLQNLAKKWQDRRVSAIDTDVDISQTRTNEIVSRNVVQEPITVILSQNGWVRALKGHIALEEEMKFKQGDEKRQIFHCNTTDRLAIFTKFGKFFNVTAHKLPDGRGFGEPLSIVADCDINAQDIVGMIVLEEGMRYLLASNDGLGFFVEAESLIAQTRNGRQVLRPADKAQLLLCKPVATSHIALIGTNRRLLILACDEIPVMAKGKGVILQRYSTAYLSDATCVDPTLGLQWQSGSRVRTKKDIMPWLGKRASRGHTPPHGFPRDNRFS
ncbi:MAG: DNA topoisomerase IV subunit A [Pseudomonadota bacterium]